MTPYYADDTVTLHHGDCLDVLRSLPDNSVDAVVTDPPYGLEFMGKDWDSFGDTRQPGDATFTPGTGPYGRAKVRYGMAPSYDSKAAAGMTGTGYTDGAERLERPSYLGGLNPKCRTCGKWQRGGNPCACDAPDFPNERRARTAAFGAWCEEWAVECLRVLKPGGYLLAFGGTRTWHRLAAAMEDSGFELRDSIAWLYGSGFPKSLNLTGDRQGWGTALKPAFEPVVVARKPLSGTVAANVLAHGTGALNVDGCRVEANGERFGGGAKGSSGFVDGYGKGSGFVTSTAGRWPTNVVLDESQAAVLDTEVGTLKSGAMRAGTRPKGERTTYGQDAAAGYETQRDTYADTGGASRFFPVFRYQAKAPTRERPKVGDVAHPTVKPLALMQWLVRLVTPPGGVVLEPFAGSGTTVEACLTQGFRCIAIEREADYLPLIEARIARQRKPDVPNASEALALFDFGGAA